ncbi:hypothetical protein D3C86_1929150 [compost metagenome]
MTIKVGDTVVMARSVIKRLNHSEYAKTFKGEVVAVFGNTCDVETVDGLRSMPCVNLAPIREIYDWRTERTTKMILDLS